MRAKITVIALLLTAVPCVAQNAAPTPAPASPSVQGYGDHDRSCQRWTDGCHTCERGPNDTVHCSNLGIACQPKETTCSTREQPPPK